MNEAEAEAGGGATTPVVPSVEASVPTLDAAFPLDRSAPTPWFIYFMVVLLVVLIILIALFCGALNDPEFPSHKHKGPKWAHGGPVALHDSPDSAVLRAQTGPTALPHQVPFALHRARQGPPPSRLRHPIVSPTSASQPQVPLNDHLFDNRGQSAAGGQASPPKNDVAEPHDGTVAPTESEPVSVAVGTIRAMTNPMAALNPAMALTAIRGALKTLAPPPSVGPHRPSQPTTMQTPTTKTAESKGRTVKANLESSSSSTRNLGHDQHDTKRSSESNQAHGRLGGESRHKQTISPSRLGESGRDQTMSPSRVGGESGREQTMSPSRVGGESGREQTMSPVLLGVERDEREWRLRGTGLGGGERVWLVPCRPDSDESHVPLVCHMVPDGLACAPPSTPSAMSSADDAGAFQMVLQRKDSQVCAIPITKGIALRYVTFRGGVPRQLSASDILRVAVSLITVDRSMRSEPSGTPSLDRDATNAHLRFWLELLHTPFADASPFAAASDRANKSNDEAHSVSPSRSSASTSGSRSTEAGNGIVGVCPFSVGASVKDEHARSVSCAGGLERPSRGVGSAGGWSAASSGDPAAARVVEQLVLTPDANGRPNEPITVGAQWRLTECGWYRVRATVYQVEPAPSKRRTLVAHITETLSILVRPSVHVQLPVSSSPCPLTESTVRRK
jgi:hypothetical protein